MGKWEMVCLGDVFPYIRNGASIKQEDNATGYPITRIETIADGSIDRNRMGYANLDSIKQYSDFVLKTGDILMSHINSVKHLGKTALYVQQSDENIIHGMNLLNLRADPDILNSVYAFRFFNSYYFKKQLPNITKNSVNQSSFNITALKKLQIPLPPLPVQRKIADVLDSANTLIEKRKAQIAKMDLLVKSQFIEMFGDPVINPKRWEKRQLANECDVVTGNTPSRVVSKYYGNFIEWIKSDNINTPDTYLTQASEMLSEAGLSVGRSVDAGTILMTCIAGSISCIGNVAIANRKVSFNQQINAIIPQKNNVYFMYYLFLLSKSYIQSTVNMSLKGILSKGKLLEIEFPFPPINLQTDFGDFIQRIETQKTLLQQSLVKMEQNYKSLMQKCFRGEIF